MEVTNDFKLYMPSEYINSNYIYFYNNNDIIVNTRQNCYNQYNTTYCDCFHVFINNNYVTSNTYQCSTTSNNSIISYDRFSSDIFNLPNFSNIFIIYISIVVICVYILKSLYSVFRKRSRV